MKRIERSERGQVSDAVGYGLVGLGGLLLVVFLVWLVMFFGGWKSTPPDKLALHYTGGPVQGVHFKEVVPPGQHTSFKGLLENWYEYPATQRNYIVDAAVGHGDRGDIADAISTSSHDQIKVDWNATTTFKLNTDPQVIKRMHEQLGLKYHAWTTKGWDTMLDQTLRKVLETKLGLEASKYDVKALYSDSGTRLALQDAVGADLKNGVNDLVGGDFFCGPSFDPSHPGVCPPLKFIINGVPVIPANIKAQFEANKQAELAVGQKQSEVLQAQAQAQAAAALNAAIANNPNYVLLKAIESGKITFWVLPQGTNVIQGPAK